MGWNGTRRTVTSAALAAVAALVLAAPPPVAAAPRTGTGTGTVPPLATTAARQEATPTPPPPRLPRDFRGKGKWIVRDLDIEVPFTWEGRDGDSQMTAGGPQYPIWFTNLIYHDTLYTLTYKWPGLTEHPCSRIPGFNLEALNQGFENARFVGPETLRRTPQRRVNHWRVGVVLPELPPGTTPACRSRWATSTSTSAIRAPSGRCCSSASRTSTTPSWTSGWSWTPSSTAPGP